ncbi:MAG: NfeD family protein [Pseudorhodobacter sp.]
MTSLWSIWWVWVVGGFVLGIIELLIPGFIFVGFAIGAVVTGLLIWFGFLGANLASTVLIFAVVSLISWLVTRKLVGTRPGQVKIWDHDIND